MICSAAVAVYISSTSALKYAHALFHFSLPVGMHAKDANFNCPWTDADDASLLRGVYKYGTGSWDAIKLDPDLKLTQVLA